MSVRLRDVEQPGARHRKKPGCFAWLLGPTLATIYLLARRIR